ncbi:MAG: beta-1,6-N-acetylglucosaminyltransferase [Acutalibacteraceae bacterium]|nr:beta-1,6-N-acetylglucosaminyltransferase [Acutalibacteraceae bacterium]
MKKHAFLIMAHTDFSLLEKLIVLLDNPYNDIYLHIDKNSNKDLLPDFSLKHSKLTVIPSISVNWGGHSQIICELNLLKCAQPNKYEYYHLLSGVDLPIKSNQYIHNFFKQNTGKEFMYINQVCSENENLHFLERIKYYYFFQNIIGRNSGRIIRIYEILQDISLKVQKYLKIDRSKKANIEFYKGSNWFSITNNLATFLIENEHQIKKIFSNTLCADELFLQTLAMQSPYKDNIVCRNFRYIDWERGNPYTFQLEDYASLLSSDNLFARKFSNKTDSRIIDAVYKQMLLENDS